MTHVSFDPFSSQVLKINQLKGVSRWAPSRCDGLEYVRDVALLRHAYVLPEMQRQGVGSHLLYHLEAQVQGVRRILVGTYAGNYKARHALDKAGYHLSADSEAVLRTYYGIPEDRLRSSVTYEKLLHAT